MTNDPTELIRKYVATFNDRTLLNDAEDVFAQDVVLINESSEMEAQGLDAFLQHTAVDWILAVPDARIELLDYELRDGAVACTLLSSGTFDGELDTPEGSIPGNGERFELEFGVEATVVDDRIARWVSDYDLTDWKTQVGIA